MNFVKEHKVVSAVIAVFILVAVIMGLSLLGKYNSLRNTAISKEAALVAQYQDNQNELTAYILQFRESLGIADRGSDKLEEILVEAVKGRYDGNMEPGTSGSMFSAISEAYPDLTATSETYAKVQDHVMNGRDVYKNKQTKLLDMIRDYNTWRDTDLVDSFIVENWVKAPTHRLAVTVDGIPYKGEQALAKISQIVLTKEAVDAYKSGTMDPLIGGDDE